MDEAKIIIDFGKELDYPESVMMYLINTLIEKHEEPGVNEYDFRQFMYDIKEELE